MILGAIVGDIIGGPYEFDHNNIKTKHFPLISKRSYFTDDSVMTMAVANALCHWNKGAEINEAEFEQTLIKSMREFGSRYPDAGYGLRFIQWLNADSPKPYNSFGNGSAMRVSPVAWYFDALEDVERYAAISARVTHNHLEGIKGAQAVAGAIYLARTGKSKSDIKSYVEKYGYDLSRTCDEIRPSYRHVESCQETVPEAITAFLEGNDFEDAVRNAVSLGGDSDTLTAITASVADGMWGVPESIEELVRPLLDEFMLSELSRWDNAIRDSLSIQSIQKVR